MPTSRIAPRERYVAKAATSEACSCAVALDDADDELLPDVAREVEVDVRNRRELAVEEAAEREVVRDRVDVREAGQVADERADRGAAPAPRRQDVAHRAGAAHLERDLARELEHLPVEEEEAGEAELVDQRELLLEPAGARAACDRSGCEYRSANAASQTRRSWTIAGSSPSEKSGIAVAELLRQVELEAFGQLGWCARTASRSSAKRSSIFSGGRRTASWLPRRSRSQPSSEVRQRTATSMSWSAARRRSCAWTSPVATVGTPSEVRELAQVRVAARVAALVRPLQLDVEAVVPEGAREPSGRVRVADREPVAGAAGEADESLVQLLEQRLVEARRHRLAVRRVARVRVRRRQQPAEVRVAACALDEQRHVRPSASVTSAPVIGRTPRCFAACANSSEP